MCSLIMDFFKDPADFMTICLPLDHIVKNFQSGPLSPLLRNCGDFLMLSFVVEVRQRYTRQRGIRDGPSVEC